LYVGVVDLSDGINTRHRFVYRGWPLYRTFNVASSDGINTQHRFVYMVSTYGINDWYQYRASFCI
jgi:Txe/YoeB family toxin of Txe-Axe toxin-antitoxin module